MIRELSRDVAIGLRDQLREMRHMIRDRRHDRQARAQPGAAPDIHAILGRAASALDDTLSTAESISRSVLPIPGTGGAIRGYRAYFGGAEDGERRFRHDFYTAFKVAQRAASGNPRPYPEIRLARIHQAIISRHGAAVKALMAGHVGDPLRPVAAVAAATLMELLDGDSSSRLDSAAAVALAAGIATLGPAEVSDADLLDAAAAAVSARRDRLCAALEGRSPEAELTGIFARLLPLLP